MSKAKRNALAVLFTAVALFMFAALLCLGFPMEEAKAESGEAAYGASVNTFTAEMPEGYLANNVSDAAAADGSSAEKTVVANITRGGQTLEFFTVQGAIDAAQDGETIKIPSCSAITEEITVASGKNIKINLLSEVTLGGTFVNNGTVAIDISAGASSRYKPSVFDATITNNAGAELSIDINYAAIGPRYAELKGTVSNSGTLTLTGTGNCNAQITNATGGVLTVKSNLNVYGAITNSGTFTIANGTYNGNIVNNGGTIAIQGGNFTQEQKEAFGDYLAEGYRWTLSSTAGNFSAIAEESVVYTLMRGDGYGFASLSAALTAADEGETIVLEKSYSIKTPNSTQKLNKSVTVDLNGNKISTQSRFEATTAGTEITVKNGSIVYTGNGSNATHVGFRVSGGASLTLDGVLVDWSSIASGRAAEVGVSNTSAAGTLILKNGSVLKGGEVGVFLAGTQDAATANKTALYAEDSIIESVAAASAGVMTNGSTYNTVIELVNTDVSGTLAIYQPSKNGTLTIDGGTMRGNTGIEIRNGTLTVKGGAEIVATGEYKVSETPSSGGSTVSGAALAVTKYENDGTLTVNIEGGTFRAESENGVAFCERNPEAADGTHSPGNVPSVSITGGIFEGGVSAVNVQKFIEGGTFGEALPAEYLAAECAQMSAEGTFTVGTTESLVTEKKAVAMNAETGMAYTSLQEAFDAAKEGETVKLLCKVTADAEIKVAQGKDITLDLNGFTLDSTARRTLVNEGKLAVVSTGERGAIIGNTSAIYNGREGDENVPDELSDVTLSLNNVKLQSTKTTSASAVALNNGPATIESIVNCEITAADGTNAIRNSGVIKSVSGTKIAVGDTSGLFGSKGTAFDLCGNFAGSGVVESVTGSNIKGNIKIATDAAGKTGSIAMNEGNTFDGEFDCGEGFYVLETENGYAAGDQTFVTEEHNAVAVNAETAVAYTSLQEAVNAADAGETVKLLCNVTADAEIKVAQGQDIVLDLNGKTLTNAAGSHTVTNYGTLTIVGNGTVTNVSGSCGALVNYGEATLLGGTFTRTKDENENWYIIKNYGAMTIGEEGQEGSVTVESELTAGAALITNGYFDAADRSDHSGLVTTVAAENACTLTIYGGTFSGGAITLKNDDLGKATIAGGAFTNGGEVAIQNSYQMTITGGSFEQTDSAGRTLVATSVNYAAEASTTISGGTFTSAGYVVANGLNNPNNSYPATAAMDISGGTFRTTSSTASAVYVFTGGNLTVTGGEFYGGSGSGYGINFRGGAGTTLAVSGADTYIEARNGIYVPTVGATVELADATVKATNRSLYFSRSDSITVTSGEYTGEVYMIPGSDTQASISGGTFNGAITVNTSNAELTGFISGGLFKQQPAAEYMDPGYAAEYRDGFYVPVESSALYIAQKEAQADVRMYAASLGVAWSDVVAAADPENASPYQAEAELVMNAYNAIAAAASEKLVAEAKLEAMGELDALYDAIEYAEQQAAAELAKIKQNYITELQNLAKGSETQEEVVVPTATYLAINNAATAEEAELYYENAVKEINDIRAYRTAIGGQADQLAELAETLEALNTSLFGTEGAGGAFNGLLGDIETAIKNAQNAIVNGAAGEEGSTSASLAGIQETLEKTIKTALDGIADTLKGTTVDLTAIKSSIEGLDVSGQLAEDFQEVIDKIAAAQGAIMGATGEGAGVSIADAVGQINEVNKATAAAVAGLREALVGTDDNGGKLGGLTTAVGALQKLLEGQDSGLAAIVAKLDAAKEAILGAASGDGGSATGLQAVLEAVNGVDEVTGKVLAAVQGLAAPESGVVAQIKGELESMLEAIEGLTGALATSNAVADVKEDIKGAQAEIDKIVAAIGSLGTAEGNDLAAKIEQVVGSLAAVQGTVGSIAESVNASTTVEAVKGDAMTDIAAWLNGYLDEILGTAGDAGSGVAVVRAFTAETTAGDIYAKLAQAFSEDNAKLVLKYYNDALAAIDAATTVSEVTTAVSTFKAQVASVEAAAQNVTDVDLTGVYVLLAILVVAVAVVIVVMILKRRQQPAAQEAAVQEAAPVQAQAAPEPVTHEVAVTDDDKEQVVIAANVRSFSEAYVDLSQELRELFNKVRAYALGKENAVEVRQSTGVCVKRNGKQIVKLTVRRNAPVALFFLENEMLKDFRRESGSQSKLKVHATELILREEADLAAAYKMVDLSLEQIDKDIAAKKERAKELRRLRRQQKAEQSKKDGAES